MPSILERAEILRNCERSFFIQYKVPHVFCQFEWQAHFRLERRCLTDTSLQFVWCASGFKALSWDLTDECNLNSSKLLSVRTQICTSLKTADLRSIYFVPAGKKKQSISDAANCLKPQKGCRLSKSGLWLFGDPGPRRARKDISVLGSIR